MTTPAERRRRGRAARDRVSRSDHGRWIPAADRPDPLAVLEQQGADRVTRLLPIRYGRMAENPFGYLRGAAAVMAADLDAAPDTGLTVQLCGDAHLVNFGVYASPERALLFDVNDFDETYPGPFEWDVKRLAASVAVAARDNGQDERRVRRAARAAVEGYATAMRRLAGMGELAVWYARVDTAHLVPLLTKPRQRERAEAELAHARRRTSLQAFGKLTEERDGRRRIISAPPLIEPLKKTELHGIGKVFSDYRATLAEDRRVLLDRYHFVDAATKVVGVGSVGTRCFIVLLEGRDARDPLFLQLKEAGRSVLEDHLPPALVDAEVATHHGGRRVVTGQHLMQAASDIFLGWTTGVAGRHFYGRQLRDMKGSVEVGDMRPSGLRAYADLCGRTLARAHARTGDRLAIAGYLGGADTFAEAVAEFAVRYADRTGADHGELVAAIADGRITATRGV
ncbi:hypothetical protein GCM10018790_11970 [Kitasatospora xanthocidica]|uniref:DUF2252 domain-containing protein n=1 Tax=Kitasatospora xanthocidica TaxID=83382 RepID=UPI00167BE5F7|nr:DUF2252 domain-containing protein [Kitasatospora xanthocidica]GHF35675.1 hypothetical protein GCM10018790_11970 [Kitasatospora xanthocidica]